MKVKRWIGLWLITAGLIHLVSAVAEYHHILNLIVERGIFNVVPNDPVIGAFVWSVFFGFVAFCGGLAVNALEKSAVAIPKTLGWSLLTLAVAGIILVPIGGFWLVFPPALGILLRRQK